MNDQSAIPFPRYKCHKEVFALKISSFRFNDDGSAEIVPADTRYDVFVTRPGWKNTYHHRSDGDLGYYVVYDDEHTSWSPTKAFEDGYTLIE